jgi:hypothetical protein
LQEERLTEIEKQNRILFGQIEEIMFRKPYKYQQSKKNPLKLTKVYHKPGDMSIKAGTYVERQSYDPLAVKQYQREEKFRQLHQDNLKVLERI